MRKKMKKNKENQKTIFIYHSKFSYIFLLFRSFSNFQNTPQRQNSWCFGIENGFIPTVGESPSIKIKWVRKYPPKIFMLKTILRVRYNYEKHNVPKKGINASQPNSYSFVDQIFMPIIQWHPNIYVHITKYFLELNVEINTFIYFFFIFRILWLSTWHDTHVRIQI